MHIENPRLIKHSLLELENKIRSEEAQVPHLRPSLQKRFVWYPANGDQDSLPSQTETSILFLHGFSASPNELSPVPENLALALKANLFLTRLSGHGCDSESLGKAKMEDWISDAKEAYEIGGRIGKKVIVIAVSTAANLALMMASDFAKAENLEALILLSPNFGLKDKRSEILLWPGGLFLLKSFVGKTHRFEPVNAAHAANWTPEYPIDALKEMMRLVNRTRSLDLRKINTPCMFLYTDHDEVIDPKALKTCFDRLGSDRKVMLAINQAKQHVLAGDCVSPETNEVVLAEMLRFVRST